MRCGSLLPSQQSTRGCRPFHGTPWAADRRSRKELHMDILNATARLVTSTAYTTTSGRRGPRRGRRGRGDRQSARRRRRRALRTRQRRRLDTGSGCHHRRPRRRRTGHRPRRRADPGRPRRRRRGHPPAHTPAAAGVHRRDPHHCGSADPPAADRPASGTDTPATTPTKRTRAESKTTPARKSRG